MLMLPPSHPCHIKQMLTSLSGYQPLNRSGDGKLSTLPKIPLIVTNNCSQHTILVLWASIFPPEPKRSLQIHNLHASDICYKACTPRTVRTAYTSSKAARSGHKGPNLTRVFLFVQGGTGVRSNSLVARQDLEGPQNTDQFTHAQPRPGSSNWARAAAGSPNMPATQGGPHRPNAPTQRYG